MLGHDWYSIVLERDHANVIIEQSNVYKEKYII